MHAKRIEGHMNLSWVENQINLQKSDSEGFSDIFRPY